MFNGLRMYTGANRMSAMSNGQYTAYTTEFRLKNAMKPASDRTIRGIGGRRKAVGMDRIQIPFSDLGTVIDVDFLIIMEAIPSLISMKDISTNGMDIYIQGRFISPGN